MNNRHKLDEQRSLDEVLGEVIGDSFIDFGKQALAVIHPVGKTVLSAFGMGALAQPIEDLEKNAGLLPGTGALVTASDYVVVQHVSGKVDEFPNVTQALVGGGKRFDGNGYQSGEAPGKRFSFGYAAPSRVDLVLKTGEKPVIQDVKTVLFLGGAEQAPTRVQGDGAMSDYLIGCDVLGAAVPPPSRRNVQIQSAIANSKRLASKAQADIKAAVAAHSRNPPKTHAGAIKAAQVAAARAALVGKRIQKHVGGTTVLGEVNDGGLDEIIGHGEMLEVIEGMIGEVSDDAHGVYLGEVWENPQTANEAIIGHGEETEILDNNVLGAIEEDLFTIGASKRPGIPSALRKAAKTVRASSVKAKGVAQNHTAALAQAKGRASAKQAATQQKTVYVKKESK